jgi:hypothetical protein
MMELKCMFLLFLSADDLKTYLGLGSVITKIEDYFDWISLSIYFL